MQLYNKLLTHRRLLTIVIIFVYVAVNLFSTRLVSADKVTIIPAYKEIRLEDVVAKEVLVTIENSSDADLVFDIVTDDFWADEEGLLTFNTDRRPDKYSLKGHIVLNESQITVPRRSKRTITANIINNSSLSPGGHYGAIVFAIRSNKSGTIPVNQNIASLLLVSKGGGASKLVTREIVTDSGIFSLPKKVELVVANEGNEHSSPSGIVELVNPLGQVLNKSTINESAGNILPETARKFTLELDNVKTIWPGKYKLQIALGSHSHTTQFWHIPLVSIVAGVLTLVAAFLLIRFRIKFFRFFKFVLRRAS